MDSSISLCSNLRPTSPNALLDGVIAAWSCAIERCAGATRRRRQKTGARTLRNRPHSHCQRRLHSRHSRIHRGTGRYSCHRSHTGRGNRADRRASHPNTSDRNLARTRNHGDTSGIANATDRDSRSHRSHRPAHQGGHRARRMPAHTGRMKVRSRHYPPGRNHARSHRRWARRLADRISYPGRLDKGPARHRSRSRFHRPEGCKPDREEKFVSSSFLSSVRRRGDSRGTDSWPRPNAAALSDANPHPPLSAQ